MQRRIGLVAFSVAAVCVAAPAGATEFGSTHADLGFNDTLLGIAPPPGLYFRDDINIQTNNRLNDQNNRPVNLNAGPGARFGVKFRNTIEADVFELAYVPNIKVPYINGTIGSAVYGAFANSRAEVATGIGVPEAGANSKAGFNDPTFVPIFIAFEVPAANLHFILSPLEFNAPLGRYSKSDPIGNNVGLNYYSYRPSLEITYLNKTGQEVNVGLGASINSQNQATAYKSGDEFYINYSFQQYLSPKFAFGLGGYYYKQTGNDTIHGQTVDTAFDPLNAGPGNKGETFAIGPVVSYNPSNRLLFEAHWDHELFAYNRPLHDQFWVRGVFKFY